MDMGITNISRTIGRTASELELKKPQPVEKPAGVNSVSENDATDKQGATKEVNQSLQHEVTNSNLAEVADKINELFQVESRSLQFNVDEDSGRTVIKIVDTKTGEQIKQIPAEELLEISRKLAAQLEGEEVKAGVLVKSKA